MNQRSTTRDVESVSSAVKTLRVLEHVAAAGECQLNDLLIATGLPKPTLSRLLGLLIEEGFIERPGHGRYRPALKLWRLGCRAVGYEDVRENVLPILRELVSNTGETAHYAVYEDGRSTYVEKVDGSHPIRSYTKVGSSSPVYATATGKALLAWRDEGEIKQVLQSARRHTPATIENYEEFRQVVSEIRDRGYAINRGEWRDGVWGLAAPIFNYQGEVVGAIGVSGPMERIKPRLLEHGTTVMNAAQRVSALNGYEVAHPRT